MHVQMKTYACAATKLHHFSQLLQERFQVTCVFWEFLTMCVPNAIKIKFDTAITSVTCSSEDRTLTTGQWSTRGCLRNDSLSNSSLSVCQCNHLTHFAILLSPTPLNFTRPIVLSLQVIGDVGVSISLIAMVLTSAIYIVFRYEAACCLERYSAYLKSLLHDAVVTCGKI